MRIADKIKQIIDDQQQKGISKYGISVDNANLSAEKWIIHAQEELADCMVYLESLKRNLSIGKIEVNVCCAVVSVVIKNHFMLLLMYAHIMNCGSFFLNF